MKAAEKAILIGLVVTILVTSMSGFNAKCTDISDNVLRLHILANSDSDQDQQLKIKVRDRILAETKDILNKPTDLAEAIAATTQQLPHIREAALDEIKAQGYNYDVSVSVENNVPFSTRHYEDVTLPAGSYTALRIKIGNAMGKNWWCVLYPPLCVGAATEKMSDALDKDETEIVTSKYEVRFAVLDWFHNIFG